MSGGVEFVTVRREGGAPVTGDAARTPRTPHVGSPLRARARELLRFVHILRGEPEESDDGDACAPCAPLVAPLLPGEPRELLLEDVAPSPERFVQLLIYCAASFLASMDWDILAPVYKIAEARFGVGAQRVNSLSNAWNVYMAPGALVALWAQERYGLRVSCLAGYATQLACAALAWAACAAPGLSSGAAFALLYASQALGALGAPLFLNNVTLLAGAWFPASERDAAVAASLLLVSAGGVFISVYAPWAVRAPGELSSLFWWQVPAWAAVLGAAAWRAADAPPAPPSAAAAVQRAARGAQPAPPSAAGAAARDVADALRNGNFMALNLSAALLTGLIYGLPTVAGQLLEPCGASNATVGDALAAMCACSGAAVLAYLFLLEAPEPPEGDAEHYKVAPHPYAMHQRVWSASATLGLAGVLASARRGVSRRAAVASWAAMGLLCGTLANGALTLEHAAELTFPLPASVSVNLLSLTGSLVSFVQVLVATALLQEPASATCAGDGARTPFAAFCLGCCAAGLLLLAALRPDARRAAAEARVQAAAEERRARADGVPAKGYGALL